MQHLPNIAEKDKLTACSDCGRPVSRVAGSCPGCGRFFRAHTPYPLEVSRAGWVVTIALGVALGLFVSMLCAALLSLLLRV